MENARLRTRLENAFVGKDTTKVTVIDSVQHQQSTYITAKVVNNTVIYRNNYITLNRRADDGVKSGLGVMGLHWVAGIITDESETFSTAYPVLTNDLRNCLNRESLQKFSSRAMD